jgi:hypothetical protein
LASEKLKGSPKEPPLIEHDPDEFGKPGLGFGTICSIVTVQVSLYFTRHDLPPWDYRDVIAFSVLLLLLWWCFRERRHAAIDDKGGRQTRNGVAFRLGEKLNRILYHRRRRPYS